jgi:hypothetical protein
LPGKDSQLKHLLQMNTRVRAGGDL